MKIIIETKSEIKIFNKWVILSKTTIHSTKSIENEPVWVNNKEYFEKEFFKN